MVAGTLQTIVSNKITAADPQHWGQKLYQSLPVERSQQVSWAQNILTTPVFQRASRLNGSQWNDAIILWLANLCRSRTNLTWAKRPWFCCHYTKHVMMWNINCGVTWFLQYSRPIIYLFLVYLTTMCEWWMGRQTKRFGVTQMIFRHRVPSWREWGKQKPLIA